MTHENETSPLDSQRALDAAVEGLYSTFTRHKLHGPVSGCPHCTSPADDERLRAKPLRHLSGDDLERFALKAVTTLGTVEDLKHFLPRMLDIAAREGSVSYVSFEIVLGKLPYAGWTSWPPAERAAIDQYLIALWHRTLRFFPAAPDADACLCGIAQVKDDLTPFLNAWGLDGSLPAIQHLSEFIHVNSRALLKHQRLSNAFWNDREQQMRQALDWLLEANTSSRLEDAFFRNAAEPVAEELSKAVETLSWVTKAMENSIHTKGGNA